MALEGRITVELETRDARVVAVRVHSSRPVDACRVLVGKRVDDALATLADELLGLDEGLVLLHRHRQRSRSRRLLAIRLEPELRSGQASPAPDIPGGPGDEEDEQQPQPEAK